MRADRLVAALLVMQARGRVTAAELAAELEVSERTARRDLEALAVAGVPVYSQRGRGGGWTLVGGARIDLTGLTVHEIRALFTVAGALSGIPELRSALRKLLRAIPAPLRPQAEAASRAVEVLEPPEARARLAGLGAELAQLAELWRPQSPVGAGTVPAAPGAAPVPAAAPVASVAPVPPVPAAAPAVGA